MAARHVIVFFTVRTVSDKKYGSVNKEFI